MRSPALSLALGVLSTLAFIGRPILGFGLLQEGRVQGGTGDPSFFAAAHLIALPLILVLASNTKKGLLRNALYVVALVNIGSVLSTVSRGGTIQLDRRADPASGAACADDLQLADAEARSPWPRSSRAWQSSSCTTRPI